MNILQRLLGTPAADDTGAIARLTEQVGQERETALILEERLAELELAQEDIGYMRLAADGDRDFSRDGLRRICKTARLYWIKNPLILRGVALKTTFVHGQGLSIQARDEGVNAIIQTFLADPKNQAALTGHQALMELENLLQVEGNLFFAFFVHPNKGRVRVRTIAFDEIDEVIADPEDALTPWFYRRRYSRVSIDLASGRCNTAAVEELHPDWRYRPAGKPATIGGIAVRWDAPVYHVAVNRLPGMRFGVSEVYAALDWARAYKEFLEDWATIVKSYARFAWSAKTKGGAANVAAVKSRFGTAMSASNGAETNPPPAAGSTFVSNGSVDLTPIKTAGATTSADDGRRLMLMVCAALGVYEHYFGDPSSGNLATAKSMERPMELMFLARRKLWADILLGILQFVIEQNATAPGGEIRGTLTQDDYGDPVVDLGDLDTHIDVDFPPLLEKAIAEQIGAIISAATLDGKTPQGIDLKTTTRMLLVALGEDDIDQLIEELFPEGWEEERAQKAQDAEQMAPQDGPPGDKEQAANDNVAEALRSLREAVKSLAA